MLEILHVPDLNLEQTSLGVLVHIYVDGEMCVDVSHLVLEALGDANDQVVDEGANCAEGSDVLAGTVVQLDLDNILLGVREVDGQMVQVLGELAYEVIPSAICSRSCSCFPFFGLVILSSGLDIDAYLAVLRR